MVVSQFFKVERRLEVPGLETLRSFILSTPVLEVLSVTHCLISNTLPPGWAGCSQSVAMVLSTLVCCVRNFCHSLVPLLSTLHSILLVSLTFSPQILCSLEWAGMVDSYGWIDMVGMVGMVELVCLGCI